MNRIWKCTILLCVFLAQTKLNECSSIVTYEDQGLLSFPDFRDHAANTYILKGNSFSRITNTTFPHSDIQVIEIVQNQSPLRIDSNAFHHLSKSLRTLAVQNVDFEFDSPFEPVIGLQALNNLEIGSSRRFSRNLSVPFLDKDTMNNLVFLKVAHSGIDNVAASVFDGDFRRLRHLSFSHNRLRFIPEGIKHVMTLPRKNILEIDISYNLLDTLLPEWLPPGCAITSLNLGYNNIRNVRLRSLDNCPYLKRLILNGNEELLYLSPMLFPNNCYMNPNMEVHLQHTDIRNVEIALRSCVGRIFFWNTSVPCSCRHMSLVNCKKHAWSELYGDCIGSGGQRMLSAEAHQMWLEKGCGSSESDSARKYKPTPMPGAGGPLASIKDWGECQMVESQEKTTPSASSNELASNTTQISFHSAPLNKTETDKKKSKPKQRVQTCENKSFLDVVINTEKKQ